MENLVRAHVYVKGQVQGVFYRAWVLRQVLRPRAQDRGAQGLKLTGWVRNLADGRVEAVMEGEKEKVTALIKLLREGPPAAKVEHVDVVWEKATGEFSRFEISK